MGMSSYEELCDISIDLLKEGRWDEAYDELIRREANGDKDAVAVLAQFYLYGVGITKDVETAIELLNKAVAMGSADAAWKLGLIYYNNDHGVPVNKHKAVEFFEKGAQGGNVDCCGVLADCYMRGDGVLEDPAKAFHYAMIAAKAGNSTGMISAAICYDDGIGTGPDPLAACHWYKEYLNYEPEDDFVMLRIALCLADPYERYGVNATDEMLNEAFYYTSKAVEKGNVEAHLIIGWFYERGKVVQQDFDLAHRYVQIAADNGHKFAKEHLQAFRKNIYGNYYIPGF